MNKRKVESLCKKWQEQLNEIKELNYDTLMEEWDLESVAEYCGIQNCLEDLKNILQEV